MDVLTGLQAYAERVQMGLCMARQYVYFLEKLSSTHYANFTWNSQIMMDTLLPNAAVIHIVGTLVMG